jgi:hypothetical protein
LLGAVEAAAGLNEAEATLARAAERVRGSILEAPVGALATCLLATGARSALGAGEAELARSLVLAGRERLEALRAACDGAPPIVLRLALSSAGAALSAAVPSL